MTVTGDTTTAMGRKATGGMTLQDTKTGDTTTRHDDDNRRHDGGKGHIDDGWH